MPKRALRVSGWMSEWETEWVSAFEFRLNIYEYKGRPKCLAHLHTLTHANINRQSPSKTVSPVIKSIRGGMWDEVVEVVEVRWVWVHARINKDIFWYDTHTHTVEQHNLQFKDNKVAVDSDTFFSHQLTLASPPALPPPPREFVIVIRFYRSTHNSHGWLCLFMRSI